MAKVRGKHSPDFWARVLFQAVRIEDTLGPLGHPATGSLQPDSGLLESSQRGSRRRLSNGQQQQWLVRDSQPQCTSHFGFGLVLQSLILSFC